MPNPNTQAPTDQLPARFRDCVVDAVKNTVSMICGAAPTCGDEEEITTRFEGVLGLIPFVGDLNWTLAMGVPKRTAIDLTQVFAGFEIDYGSSEMGDAIGELVNILAGDLSSKLDAIGFCAKLGLPTVAQGSDLQMVMKRDQPRLAIRCESSYGAFWVRILTDM